MRASVRALSIVAFDDTLCRSEVAATKIHRLKDNSKNAFGDEQLKLLPPHSWRFAPAFFCRRENYRPQGVVP